MTAPETFAGITHETAHAEAALERVLAQDHGKPRIEGIARIHAARMQKCENAAWDLLTKRYLDTAEGVQLDALGKILRMPRPPATSTDDEYRLVLAGQIQALRSCGSVPAILAVFQAVFPTALVHVDTRPPAYVLVTIDITISHGYSTVCRALLRRARAGGVKGMLVWHEHPLSQTFTFKAVGASDDAALGFGHGHLAGAGSG